MGPGLMIAGTAVQILGQIGQNYEQSLQERINAKFYNDQADYAAMSAVRAQSIANFDHTQKISHQASAYAGAGVEISGSAALTIGGQVSQAMDEIWALRKKGELDVKLARMRGSMAEDRARTLGSFDYNLMQAATIGLSNAANSKGFGLLGGSNATNTSV